MKKSSDYGLVKERIELATSIVVLAKEFYLLLGAMTAFGIGLITLVNMAFNYHMGIFGHRERSKMDCEVRSQARLLGLCSHKASGGLRTTSSR